MGWLSIALNSSIGKKFVMALTGICLILFLVIHLINNLTLFAGPELFNTVVKGLDSIKPLIRVVEVILALIFIFHIYEGVRLWWENKKARPVSYAVNGSSKNSDIYSRTMIWTGSIVFIFLVIHLRTLWVTFNFDPTVHEGHRYYDAVVSAFQSPVYSLFYVVAVVILGFHLNHGFQSAFQTFGWNHKKYFPFIKRLGFIYSLLTALAFASIPIYFLFFFGGK
ncbi:MAG: succinate dehydrogenase cytochrome b subunit [Bacteroidetes bacterium]|nr:succinate dehydrogenase cytochrome b subunit [Bacteroidota bacterium]